MPEENFVPIQIVDIEAFHSISENFDLLVVLEETIRLGFILWGPWISAAKLHGDPFIVVAIFQSDQLTNTVIPIEVKNG